MSKRVASGVAWNIAEKIGSTLLQAIVSIIVANRIMPDDMGIIAVLTVFVTLSQVVIDSGFSQTLIRKANATAEDFKAVFRFNLIASVALYAILTATTPWVASYYGWELIRKVAPVLYLLLPLNALCVIQNTIMVKEFRFAQLSTIIFFSSLISGILAIVMALTGFGIWSLVGQRVSMMATKAILLWWKSPWRWRRDIKTGSLREMTPYSLRLIATDMITAIYNNIAQLFIGKIYSADMLGYYTVTEVGYMEIGDVLKVYISPGETFGELLDGGKGIEGFPYDSIRDTVGENTIVFDLMNDAAGYVANDANFVLAGLQYNEADDVFDSDTWCLISYGKNTASTLLSHFYGLVEANS